MTKKVWVCIAGEYSDQRVAAVFSKEADAKRCEELFNWEPKEMELDSVPVSTFPEGVKSFRATISHDEVKYVNLCERPPEGWDQTNLAESHQWSGSFWAKDHETAVDIAWEKVLEVSPHPAEALARNEKRKRDRTEAAVRIEQNRAWLEDQSEKNRAALIRSRAGDRTDVTQETLKELGLVNPDAAPVGIPFPWLKRT